MKRKAKKKMNKDKQEEGQKEKRGGKDITNSVQ